MYGGGYMSLASDQRQFSEQIAGARQAIDATLIMLKTQLQSLNAKINTAINDIDAHGMNAKLKYLGTLHEQGTMIDNQIKILSEQRSHMKQIIMHIEMIRDA